MRKLRKVKGITLISLVVTIIILIILSAVTINLVLGENGIINFAKNAKEQTEKQMARETLEITLLSAGQEKATNEEYNENEWLNSYITLQNKEHKIVIIGDLVNIDGWKFEIDRSVPRIVADLGKGNKDESIQIELLKTIREDYVNGNLTVSVTANKNINLIQIDREEFINPSKEDEKYGIEKTINENGTYKVIATDEEGNYNIASIDITEITEDMQISTKEDLISFREKVNSGRTFEGKTVTVMNDIDLQGSEENRNWTKIGNATNKFKGTFEGNNYKISNLYNQNINEDQQGLFGVIENANIQNLTINSSNIKGNITVGAFIGRAESSTIQNLTITSSNVKGEQIVGAFVGKSVNSTIKNCKNEAIVYSYKGVAGGIIGITEENGQIINCSNLGKISSELYWKENQDAIIGGIVGINYSATINKCTNFGDIQSVYSVIGGIAGVTTEKIEECTNFGNLSCTNYNKDGASQIGGIVGYVNNTTIKNCSNNGNINAAGTLNGGIVGNLHTLGRVENCYNTGRIETQKGNSRRNCWSWYIFRLFYRKLL